MKKTRLISVVILCLICSALATGFTATADDIVVNNEVIAEDNYESVSLLFFSQGDKVDVMVDVKSPAGARVDVYIMSSNEYIYDYPDTDFTAVVTRENVEQTSFTYTIPDSSNYYLVIDNTDNAKSTDAEPTGSVTVDYEYTDPFTSVEEAAEALAWTCIAGVIIVIVIVIVIIVVIVMLVFKKEKPPAQPAQYQQPPQQGYQQPPGQYQQPPPPGDYQQGPPPSEPYQPPPGPQP